MPTDAVGRRQEANRIDEILWAVAGGASGHVIELTGDAGIGKSTLVRAVLDRAEAAGWRVFRATPTAAEAILPWTTLAQLAVGVEWDAVDALMAVHLEQLRAATSSARSTDVSPELVAFGLAALLDSVRGDVPPVLFAVDDAQWLDRPTAGALAYALRGTPSRKCVALLSSRSGEPMPLEPGRLVPAEAFTRVELGGLSVASLREIIAASTGHTFGRAELAQIHQRTGGNPLYAIELARMVLDGVPPQAAALPASLRDTVGRLVRVLPADTRVLLGAAALAAHPSLELLARAFPGIAALPVLAPAESADIAAVRRSAAGAQSVVFRHPLLAAAAIDALTADELHRVHLGLAEATTDVLDRAAHLAALGGPDEARADELATAAAEARARGAADTGADLAGAALAATPPGTDALTLARRRRLFVELAVLADRMSEAKEMAELVMATIAAPPPADDRSPADLAWREIYEDALLQHLLAAATMAHMEGAAELARAALAELTDPVLRWRAHYVLVRATLHENVTRGAEVAEDVFGPGTEHHGGWALRGETVRVIARCAAGLPVDLGTTVADLDRAAATPDQAEWLRCELVEPFVWTDHPGTIALVDTSIARSKLLGNRPAVFQDQHQVLTHLFVRGLWNDAERMLEAVDEFSEAIDADPAESVLMLIQTGRGHAEAADTILAALRARQAERPRSRAERLWVNTRIAMAAHALGRPDAADRLLAAEQQAAEFGVRAVRGLHFRRDLVEALVAAGRLDEATAAAERLAADAELNQVPTAFADADASAAMVEAARGNHDAARARFAVAVAVQREYDLRYELARTLLAAGATARRTGARSEARDLLDESRGLFDGIGATLWVGRVDDEAARLGDRRTADDPAGLTPTERQIAEQVATGRTNAEIAAALFVSVRTVESNLTRTYRKLGLRSRTELAAHVRNVGTPDAATPARPR